MVGARIIAILAGYVLGMFQTGYIYGKAHGIDIRTKGSGNAGTTNTLRVLGWKAGLVTFAGDLCKAIFSVLIIHLIFRDRYPDAIGMLDLYAGFGAVLGHNFPFYMKFQGGKGIACTSGMIVAVFPISAPICLVLFILSVGITRYVSLGSILVVIAFLIQVLVFGQMGYISLAPSYLTEFYIVSACFTVMGLWRHRANIKRLLTGTENKFGMIKKEEK